jgi:hypothetical protein
MCKLGQNFNWEIVRTDPSFPIVRLSHFADKFIVKVTKYFFSEFKRDSLLVRFGEHVMRLKDTKQVGNRLYSIEIYFWHVLRHFPGISRNSTKLTKPY